MLKTFPHMLMYRCRISLEGSIVGREHVTVNAARPLSTKGKNFFWQSEVDFELIALTTVIPPLLLINNSSLVTRRLFLFFLEDAG